MTTPRVPPGSAVAQPPRAAVWLIARVLPGDEREAILGDLDERFGDRAQRHAATARRWYWRTAVVYSAAFLAQRLRGRQSLLTHRFRARRPHLGPASTRELEPMDLFTYAYRSCRSLAHAWKFALAMVLILAAGIGPAAAVYSVVDRILLEPLEYRDAERIGLMRINLRQILDHPGLAQAEIRDLRETQGLFDAVEALTRPDERTLESDGELTPVVTVSVTPGLFEVLGVSPSRGRRFVDDDLGTEEQPRDPVAIVSHGFWRDRLGEDPDVLGRTVRLNGRQTIIIGVMPEGFAVRLGRGSRTPTNVDVWRPRAISERRDFWGFATVVRLADGISFEQVNERLEAFATALVDAHPDIYADADLRYWATPLLDDLVHVARPFINMAFAAVVLLFGVAVVNAAALNTTRQQARATDLTVRSAIGAGRATLLRTLLDEGIVLAVVAWAAASAVAVVTMGSIQRFIPSSVPRSELVRADATLLVYAGLASALAFVFWCVLPAWRAVRRVSWRTLRGDSLFSGRSGSAARNVMVGAQLAMAVVLLFAGVQLVRSAGRLADTELGFETARTLTFSAPLEADDILEQWRTYQGLRDDLATLPGVVAVGAISHLPLSGTGPIDGYTPDLENTDEWGSAMANYFAVIPGYFESVGMRLQRGRLLEDRDLAEERAVAVIDDWLAQDSWPGEDPIGKTIRAGWGLPNLEVVGVVAHARVIDVRDRVRPQIYVPYTVFQWGPLNMTVRSAGDPLALASVARESTVRVSGARAPSRFATLDSNLGDATSVLRATLALISLLAGIAAGLAAFGLYSVVSYVVQQGRREAAIRSALGATPRRLLERYLRTGLGVVGTAVPVGIAVALVGGSFLESLVYGVSPRDPISLALAATLAVAIGLLASVLPARRAARTDPARALRAT